MRFVRNTIWLTVATGLIALSGVVSQSLMIRYLPRADYDAIVLLVSLTSFFTIVSHLGLPLAVTQGLAESHRKQGAFPRGKLIGAGLGATLGATAVFMVLLFVAGQVAYRLGRTSDWGAWLWVTPLWLLGSAALRIGEGVTNGYQRMHYSAVIRVFQELARLAGLVALVALGLTLKGLVGVYTAVAMLGVAFTAAMLWRFFRRVGVRPQTVSARMCRRMVRRGVTHYYIPYLVANLVLPALPLAVGLFARTPGEVGSFRYALMITGLIVLPVGALVTSALPRMASADVADMRRLGGTLMKLLGAYSVLMAVVFLYAAEPVVRIASKGKYVGPVAVVHWLALSRLAICVAVVPDVMLRSRHTARANSAMETVRFVALAILVPLATWHAGMLGAAMAFTVCMVAGLVAQVVMVHRLLSISLYRELLGVAAPVAVAIVARALGIATLHGIAAVAAAGLAGLAVTWRPGRKGTRP